MTLVPVGPVIKRITKRLEQTVGIVRRQHGVGVRPGHTRPRPAGAIAESPGVGRVAILPVRVRPEESPARHPVERLRQSGGKLHVAPAATGARHTIFDLAAHQPDLRAPGRTPPHPLGEHQGVIVGQPDLSIGGDAGVVAPGQQDLLRSLQRQWSGRDDAIVGFKHLHGRLSSQPALQRRAQRVVPIQQFEGFRRPGRVRHRWAGTNRHRVIADDIGNGEGGHPPTTGLRQSPAQQRRQRPSHRIQRMDIGAAIEQRPGPGFQDLRCWSVFDREQQARRPPDSRNSTGAPSGNRRHSRQQA